MTKPAAVFAQVIGFVLALLGIGYMGTGHGGGSAFMLTFGVVLFVAGGMSARRRIKGQP